MDNIQVGSFVLNGQMILNFICWGAGWLALRYYLRDMAERSSILSYVTNAFLIWLFVWKGSYIIFHFIEFSQQPISLLYFDGGERGRWLASIVTAVYIGFKFSKQNLSLNRWINIATCFTFAAWLAYHVLFIVTGEVSWFHIGNAVMSSVLLAVLLLSPQGSNSHKGSTYAIWFSIANVLLMFLDSDRMIWIVSFSKLQFIFLLVAAILIGWSWFDEKKKGEFHG